MSLGIGIKNRKDLTEFQKLWLFVNSQRERFSCSTNTFLINALGKEASTISHAKSGNAPCLLTAREWSNLSIALCMPVDDIINEILK